MWSLGFAQPSRYVGAKQYFAKPLLRRREELAKEVVTPASSAPPAFPLRGGVEAGVQCICNRLTCLDFWIPASAGMTKFLSHSVASGPYETGINCEKSSSAG